MSLAGRKLYFTTNPNSGNSGDVCWSHLLFYVTDECFSWYLLFSFQMSAPVTHVSMGGPAWTGSMGLTAPVEQDIPETSVRFVSGKLCAPHRSAREGRAWMNTRPTGPCVSVMGDIGSVSLHNYLPYSQWEQICHMHLSEFLLYRLKKKYIEYSFYPQLVCNQLFNFFLR